MSAVPEGALGTLASAPRAPVGLPRLLTGLDGGGASMSLSRHREVHGALPAHSAQSLIDEVEQSGLRGRGGADFPTAIKLRSVANGRRRPSAVVVNGSETEPISRKDRLLMASLPHLVLDGAELAAGAVGTDAVIVKVGDASFAAYTALATAIEERASESRIGFSLTAGPEGYVAGEESAVVSYLSGGAPIPTFVPPRPYERGLRGRPTLIQNPETLAQIALVARHGGDWYRQLGTPADPGSALVTIAGAVAAPGVYELAFGTSMTDLLDAAGGPREPLQALLVGGYFGTWMEFEQAASLGLSREQLRSVGCSLGSGVLFALGQSACGLHESAWVMQYLAAQSAGQCGPCVHGLAAIAETFTELADGRAGPGALVTLERWSSEVRGRGACHHPDGAIRFLQSSLRLFGGLRGHSPARCGAGSAGLPLPGRATSAGSR